MRFVPKDANPPNMPQLRPIENTWLWLKWAVYANGWETENIDQLEVWVKKSLRQRNWEPVRRARQDIKGKIRKAADRGALAVLR